MLENSKINGNSIPAEKKAPDAQALLVPGKSQSFEPTASAHELKELRENEFYYRTLFESLPVGMIAVDRETHRIVDVNAFALYLMGKNRQDLIGSLCHGVICPSDIGRCPITDLGQNIDQSERVLLSSDNKGIPVLKTVVPIVKQGTTILVEYFVDLRARKQLEAARIEQERAEGANRAKSEFLSHISHEIRTPLTAIIGYSELMHEELLDNGGPQSPNIFRQDLEKIIQSARHLQMLINDLLDLSRIEAGKSDVILDRFEIHALAEDVIGSAKPMADRNKNHLGLSIEDDLGAMETDKTKLRQILINLIGNACKFTRNGRILLTAKCIRPDQGDWIQFQISDTGIGMTRQQLQKLFQPFSQGDESIAEIYGGSGLGLAISKRLCELLGGNISAESQLNEGSVFTVAIPRIFGKSC